MVTRTCPKFSGQVSWLCKLCHSIFGKISKMIIYSIAQVNWMQITTIYMLLSLEFNKLRTVPKRALAGLNKMTAIDLSANSLHGNAIEAGALELPSLREVNIAGNEYTQIPPNLPRNLTSLIVGDNPITRLDTTSFANYTSLTVLDLYAANLT